MIDMTKYERRMEKSLSVPQVLLHFGLEYSKLFLEARGTIDANVQWMEWERKLVIKAAKRIKEIEKVLK
jgi:hypothetical protein